MTRRSRLPRMASRRGSALVLVLLMTLAVAALAVAAIFMTSSAGLLARFYDKERLFAYAAESGLNMVLARMRSQSNFTIGDSNTPTVLLSGVPVRDADGNAIPGANVFVYAMRTGDTMPTGERTITLLSRAYDSFGTRHVRRMDVRQESITKYVLFIDNFPSGLQFGPTVLTGRVHSNGNLVNRTQTKFNDSVTVVGTNQGGTFVTGLRTGADSVPFPRNSSFSSAITTASNAGLSITPTAGRPGRIEFVDLPLDPDGNGIPNDTGAFIRYFELAAGLSDSLIRVTPPVSGGGGNEHHPYDHPIIQRQCGAFYLRSGRWQFFPVATHRANWAWNIINTTGYPTAPVGGNLANNANARAAAAKAILQLPTSRCFPAGSPYLMPTERLTTNGGVVSATATANIHAWGTSPAFPSTLRYGGQDTTFTPNPRSCVSDNNGGCLTGSEFALGSWRVSPSSYTAVGGAPPAPDSMLATHWPIDARRNTAFAGIVNVSGSTLVSGVVRGNVTLRVGGTAWLVDQLVYETDPNDPAKTPCTDMFGLMATSDILVVDGLMTRIRRYGVSNDRYDLHLGAAPFFVLNGFLLSSGGTVGVENPAVSMVSGGSGLECRAPPDQTPRRRASGGCFVHVGGAAMRTYSEYTIGQGSQNGGMLPFPIPDRCQSTGRQPPGFPQVASFRVLRTLEVDASRANTDVRIERFLRSLRGRNLD